MSVPALNGSVLLLQRLLSARKAVRDARWELDAASTGNWAIQSSREAFARRLNAALDAEEMVAIEAETYLASGIAHKEEATVIEGNADG